VILRALRRRGGEEGWPYFQGILLPFCGGGGREEKGYKKLRKGLEPPEALSVVGRRSGPEQKASFIARRSKRFLMRREKGKARVGGK